MRRSGFTLIELLVVIAIIAILAAILFPVFMTARQSAKHALCLAHVKQLGAAMLNYAADNRDTLPPFERYLDDNGDGQPEEVWWKERWDWLILPYVKNNKIYQCPIHTREKSASSFAVNVNLVWRNYASMPPTAMSTGIVKRPSRVVMLFDAQTEQWQRQIGQGNGGNCFYYVQSPPARYGHHITGMRHGDGDNFCFADGHAKWYELRSMKDAGMSPIYDWKGISFRTDY